MRRYLACHSARSRHKTLGQGLVEYALVIALITIVMTRLITTVGGGAGEIFFKATCTLNRSAVWYSLDGIVWYEHDEQGKAMIISCLEGESIGLHRLAWDRTESRSLILATGTTRANTSIP